MDSDWTGMAKMAIAAIAGLAANAVLVMQVVGNDLSGMADGLMMLTPAVALAAAMFHKYNPVQRAYIAPLILFIAIGVANTLTLTVRVFQTFGAQSDPVMAVVIIAAIALMFTPVPFLGAWAARRWWVTESAGGE